MDVNNIDYPVFIYNENWSWKLTKTLYIKEANEKYCTHLYKKIMLIDSNLNLFKINNIEMLSKAGFLGYKMGLKGKHFKIKENYIFIKNITLTDFKNILLNLINNNHQIYDSGLIIEDLIKDIKTKSSFIEIMDLLPSSD